DFESSAPFYRCRYRFWQRREAVVKETKRWRSVGVLMARCSLLVFVLLGTGCLYWGRRRVDQPTPIKPSNPVWIWSGGTVEKWHAVVITENSVSGIPYRMPLWCGSCGLAVPGPGVDHWRLVFHRFPELVSGAEGVLPALHF